MNIAARMESLAPGGGICISGTVYDQVKNKLDVGYEYSGEHKVKNIIEPVRVYRVSMRPEATAKLVGDKKPVLRRWHLAVIPIVLVIGAAVFWIYYMGPRPVSEEPLYTSKTALQMDERSSIAVLPFSNLSGEPEQECFSDGITNDARSLAFRGQVLLWSGKVDAAIHSLETAYRFDPNMLHGNFMFLGIGYFLKGHYERAINVLKEGLSRKPDWVGNHIILAAAYAQSDRSGDAKREAQEVLRIDPFFAIDNYGTVFRNRADRAKIVQGLRKAGLKKNQFPSINFDHLSLAFFRAVSALAANLSAPFLSQLK